MEDHAVSADVTERQGQLRFAGIWGPPPPGVAEGQGWRTAWLRDQRGDGPTDALSRAPAWFDSALAARVLESGQPLATRSAPAAPATEGVRGGAPPSEQAVLWLPFDAPDASRGVLALGFGAAAERGAVEVWRVANEQELTLGSGDYGRNDEFHRLSALMRFPRGVGLPGGVWESGLPRLMTDLGTTEAFIRALAARSFGLSLGLGIPVFRSAKFVASVVLISAAETPLTEGVELWAPGTGGGPLERVACCHAARQPAQQEPDRPSTSQSQHVAERAWSCGEPVIVSDAKLAAPSAPGAARAQTSSVAIGIPVSSEGALRSVVVLLD